MNILEKMDCKGARLGAMSREQWKRAQEIGEGGKAWAWVD